MGTGVEIENFRKSFSSGLAFVAIMHGVLGSDRVNMVSFSHSSRQKNFEFAFRVADEAGQPPLLDIDDCLEMEHLDPQSVMTYVFELQRRFS